MKLIEYILGIIFYDGEATVSPCVLDTTLLNKTFRCIPYAVK